MDNGQITKSMNQQLELLRALEILLELDAKEQGGHGVKPEDIEALRAHVANMRKVCETASIVATHYNLKSFAKTAKTADPKPVESTEPESAKKPRKTKPEEKPTEEPAPVQDPEPEPEELDNLSFLD